jgi:hypothetical protein
MTHIAIAEALDGKVVDWMEHVSVDAMINNAVPFEGGIRRFDGPQAPKSAK